MSRAIHRCALRIAIAMLVASALAGHLGALAHLAVTQHVACAEHGELVEVAASTAALPTQTTFSALEAHHGHDHCAIASARRERITSERAAPNLVRTAVTIACLPRSIDVAPPIDVLAFAPKSSPPVSST